MRTLSCTLCFIFTATVSLSGSQSFHSFPSCSYFSSPMNVDATTSEKPLGFYGSTYKPSQNCKWIIQTRNKDQVIRLRVVSWQLEGTDIHGNCVADYVDIFDVQESGSIFLDRFCSQTGKKELMYQSSQSSIIVNFISNAQFNYLGFQLFYRSQEKESEDDSLILSLVVGISTGSLVIVILFCVLVIVYRMRKRKASERLRRRTANQGNALSDITSSLPTSSPPPYSSDISPFVAREFHSARGSGRSSSPPPPYERVDHRVPLDTAARRDAPPSYDDALRESANIQTEADSITYV